MVRRAALIASALVALSARAQEVTRASAPEGTVSPAAEASPVDGGQPSVVVASTTPVPDRPSRPPAASPAGQPDTGASELAPRMAPTPPMTCRLNLLQMMLADGRTVDRRYPPAPNPRIWDEWEQAPWVSRALRCGQGQYLIQVASVSAAPWVLKEARLEGLNGQVLHVEDMDYGPLDEWSVNVLLISVPAKAGPDYPLTRLHLTGTDGRVATPDGVRLP